MPKTATYVDVFLYPDDLPVRADVKGNIPTFRLGGGVTMFLMDPTFKQLQAFVDLFQKVQAELPLPEPSMEEIELRR